MWLGFAIPEHRVRAAFGTFTLYLMVFCLGCYAVLANSPHTFEDNIFETASALGTVGLSRGITGDLTASSKLTLSLLMYIGRVGVISLGVAALARPAEEDTPAPEQDVVV